MIAIKVDIPEQLNSDIESDVLKVWKPFKCCRVDVLYGRCEIQACNQDSSQAS